MRVYYIAYEYSDGQIEMMCGPYGTASEASQERDSMLNGVKDEKLVIVRQVLTVEKV